MGGAAPFSTANGIKLISIVFRSFFEGIRYQSPPPPEQTPTPLALWRGHPTGCAVPPPPAPGAQQADQRGLGPLPLPLVLPGIGPCSGPLRRVVARGSWRSDPPPTIDGFREPRSALTVWGSTKAGAYLTWGVMSIFWEMGGSRTTRNIGPPTFPVFPGCRSGIYCLRQNFSQNFRLFMAF